MNISKKINFAIVGCGMIAHAHASSLLDIYNANLIGAWDLDDSIAQDFCKKYSISKYNSFEEILNDEKIDAVCICTPSYCHYEQTQKALTSGKNVVVEKPMALFASEAKKLCDLAKDNNKIIGFIWCYPRTFYDESRLYINSLIVSGEYRNQGIGQKLIEEVFKKGRELNCDAIDVGCAAFNEKGLKFYHRLGFIDERVQLVKKY